mmetsp:Transcript_11712/g.17850  ORF Transcript_11712/g.17850 Transcript_11712/m.17850 type:complete len:417 (-) Transcript_11712:9814-11064(-)
MVLQKQEDELKNRVLKLAKRNYNSLGTFIRLIDYMVVETQVKINQESSDLILTEMSSDKKKVSIQTSVSFATEGMSFEPAKSEFITQFEKILQDMQSVTEEVSRVISHQDFHQFIHGLISDSGPRFRAIVEGSEAYATSKATIQARISQDFDELQKDVAKYEKCREIDEFDREFVFEEWKQQHSDLESIKKYLEKLARWDNDITGIRASDNKGLIAVQGRRLTSRLSQKVKDEQGNMKEYLLKLAEKKAKDIQHSINEIKTTLSKPPATLQSYVDFVNKLESCKASKEELAESKKKLEEMKQVLQRHKQKDEGFPNVSHTSLQSKIEGLTTELADIEMLITKAEEETKESRDNNVEELGKRVIEEQEKVMALIEKVTTSEILIRADTPAKEALDEASKIKKRFDESVKKLGQFKSY